jgi:hypothetical protein
MEAVMGLFEFFRKKKPAAASSHSMKKTRAEFEPWLRDYLRKRQPDLEPQMLAAIDAFDIIQEENRVDSALLAPIVEAASSSRRPLCENATSFLGKLTGEYVLARESVDRMALDSRSYVRFNAILCLGKATPLDFAIRLIRQGLRDKSAHVRKKAADWAGSLRLREAVPDLESALTVETNTKAKETIEFELRLLRDGHILEPDSDDGFFITAFISNGVGGRWVSRVELEQRGIETIIAEMASR